jgi:hypothetical protein
LCAQNKIAHFAHSSFAAMRMNKGIQQALAGKNIATI